MMDKLCLIFNFAPHYRRAIYELIDQTWDCDWYFGSNQSDIKTLDLSLLRNAVTVPRESFIHNPFYRLKGVTALAADSRYDRYLAIGEPYCVSIWWLMLRLRLFYPQKRIYLWSHGYYGRESFLKRVMKKAFFKLAHKVFLYGDYARELMIQQGFSPEKLIVVHNSLQYDEQLKLRKQLEQETASSQTFGERGRNLIFIGRLTRSKRLDLLLDAMVLLRERGLDTYLTIVGDGEDRSHLEHLVQERGLGKQVRFWGACYDEAENARLLYEADLCVSPGNVGLTAIHSMMFGTPVLTHDDFRYQGPEFEAIKSGETGDYFQENNVTDIVVKIEKWLSACVENRSTIRNRCFNEVDRYWTPLYQQSILCQYLR